MKPRIEKMVLPLDEVADLNIVIHRDNYGDPEVVVDEINRQIRYHFRARFRGSAIDIEKEKMVGFNVLEHLYSMGFPKWLSFLLPRRFKQNPSQMKNVRLRASYMLTDPQKSWVRDRQVYLLEMKPPQLD